LEDVFPTEIVTFLGDMLVFRGVNAILALSKHPGAGLFIANLHPWKIFSGKSPTNLTHEKKGNPI